MNIVDELSRSAKGGPPANFTKFLKNNSKSHVDQHLLSLLSASGWIFDYGPLMQELPDGFGQDLWSDLEEKALYNSRGVIPEGSRPSIADGKFSDAVIVRLQERWGNPTVFESNCIKLAQYLDFDGDAVSLGQSGIGIHYEISERYEGHFKSLYPWDPVLPYEEGPNAQLMYTLVNAETPTIVEANVHAVYQLTLKTVGSCYCPALQNWWLTTGLRSCAIDGDVDPSVPVSETKLMRMNVRGTEAVALWKLGSLGLHPEEVSRYAEDVVNGTLHRIAGKLRLPNPPHISHP